MPFPYGGYTGRLLRVNLTTAEITVEDLDPDVCRAFVGGPGIAAHILFQEVPPFIEAFDPRNRLIIASGPLTGTGVDGAVHGLFRSIYNPWYRHVCLRYIETIVFFTRSFPDSLGLSSAVREKIRVIRPAVDTLRFSPSGNGAAVRVKYGFSNRQPVVLFVSALQGGDQCRGAGYLIAAMDRVRKEIPQTRLVIVGEGGLLPELKRQVEELELGQHVLFAGGIYGDELARHYAMCDLFALPSSYESFGFTVLEAMASGKPAIVSDIPGVGEIVRSGETGLKVLPRDPQALAQAMMFLLGNDETRSWMGQNARKEVEGRTWEQVAKEVAEVHGQAVERS
jgi:glycosyltransferase involved in cell wall biosynthesis